MKIVVVFSCLSALVLLSAHPAHRHANLRSRKAKTLEEMVKTLNHLDRHLKDERKWLTPNSIDKHSCKPEDFCRVQTALSKIVHKDFGENGKIVRQLREYNKHHNQTCTLPEDTEVPLADVLHNLRICVQRDFANTTMGPKPRHSP